MVPTMRDMFVTLREFLWTVIAVLAAGALAAAVLVPAQFADRSARVFEALQHEGFDIKIKTPLGEASFARVKQEIADSDARIIQLEQDLGQARGELERLNAAAEAISNAGVDIEELYSDWNTIEPNVLLPRPEPWVVIAGTQRSLDGQRVQLARLRDAGIENAVILQVDGWFQTAVIYDGGRDAAQAGLDRVSGVVGADRGAYIRALNRICPVMIETPGDPDLWRCSE